MWVNVSNGTKTGGGTRGGCYEASEPLLESATGRTALAGYLSSSQAEGMLKYIFSAVQKRLQPNA